MSPCPFPRTVTIPPYLIYMYEKDLALNNLQRLICYKTKPKYSSYLSMAGEKIDSYFCFQLRRASGFFNLVTAIGLRERKLNLNQLLKNDRVSHLPKAKRSDRYIHGFLYININTLVPVVQWLLSQDMDTVTRVQILDLTDCISHSTNILGKGMNPKYSPSSNG